MTKPPSWLNARDAAALLDIKLQTLYAYASRGLVESVPGPRGRGRRYARASVERLKARHDARSGHGPVAAGALRFGEPTLETSISDIRSDGPYYRGHSALALCEAGVPFESVFDLLVFGSLELPRDWARQVSVTLRAMPLPAAAAHGGATPSAYLAALLALAGLADAERHGASEREERERARQLVVWLAGCLSGRRCKLRGASVAERLLGGLGARADAYTIEVVDRVLVLCADHELNASTFAARVAASTGADLYACLATALHTLSGGLHGAASARVEALLREIARPSLAAQVLRERLARGQSIPGFGQPLYPDGDPRGRALFALAERAAARSRHSTPEYERLRALCSAMERAGHPAPNLDAGLVAVCSALALPPGAAAAVFAIGRIPGWVAHILEQRTQHYILRPRARYLPAEALTPPSAAEAASARDQSSKSSAR
jgi:citrate synthase